MNPDQNTYSNPWLPVHRLGKKVLDPGGKVGSEKLVQHMNITIKDDVCDWSPLPGYTTFKVLSENPRSLFLPNLIIRESDKISPPSWLPKKKPNWHRQPAENQTFSKALSVNYLHLLNEQQVTQVFQKAYRDLKPGALFGLHELSLQSQGAQAPSAAHLQGELSQKIHRPVKFRSHHYWLDLLEKTGFRIYFDEQQALQGRHKPALHQDEGLWGAFRIYSRSLFNQNARERSLALWNFLRKHNQHLCASLIVGLRQA